MKNSAPIAVPLLVAFYAVPWVLYLRDRPDDAPVRMVRTDAATARAPEPAPPPAPEAEPVPVRQEPSAGDPLGLQALALKLAADEARKMAEAESAMTRMEEGLALAESYRIARRWVELADLAENLLRQRPDLKFVLLEPRELRHRLLKITVPLGRMMREAQLALLDAASAESADEQKARADVRIRLANELRELGRQQAELDGRPAPPNTARVDDGHTGPFSPVEAARIQRDCVETKMQSMRMTVQFNGRPLEEAVSFLREFSGLNIVTRGMDPRSTLVTMTLKDVTLDGIFEHLTVQTGLAWDVDRFGVLTLSPKK